MKLLKTAILTIVLLLSATQLMAEQPSMGANLTVKSKYMFRGIDYSNGSVFQPDVWISWGDFSITTWFSIDLTDTMSLRGEVTEVDILFDYAYDFKHVTAGLGYGSFSYPTDPGSQNGSAYLSLNSNFDIVNVKVTANYDMWATKFYLEPKISAGYTFANIVTPTLSASVGIGGKNFHMAAYNMDPDNKFNDFKTSLAVDIALPGKVGEILSASGNINYSSIINSDVADYVEDVMKQDKGQFWGGFTLSAEF